MEAGECVLETNVGRVELGVSAQLEEIERGSSICCSRGRRDECERRMRAAGFVRTWALFYAAGGRGLRGGGVDAWWRRMGRRSRRRGHFVPSASAARLWMVMGGGIGRR